MAISKLLVVSIAIALVIAGVRSAASIGGEIVEPVGSESPLRLELDGIRSKILALESSIENKIREIKVKEESITQLNTVIQEKLSSIVSLESEIESLQKKGATDAQKVAGKADARAGELEKQIAKLRDEIEAQSRKRNGLDARVREAEKKAHKLDMRLESLQKTNKDQKLRIRKTQHALELAEEELMKAQLDATSKVRELTEVHGAWLPHWLVTYVSNIQDFTATHWNEHAKPSLVDIFHKVSEKWEQVQIWAEPHLDSAKTKWIPAAKEQLVIYKSNAGPYLRKMFMRTIEVYEASKSTVVPHIFKIQQVTYPYFQEARKFSEPYIDQVVTLTKPHLKKLRLVLKPYTKYVVRVYRKVLRRVRSYHHQVQGRIQEKLKTHKLTKPHATKELAWFLASALLVFPLFFLFRLLSAVFCSKKARKSKRTAKSNQTHRRPKRRHADK